MECFYLTVRSSAGTEIAKLTLSSTGGVNFMCLNCGCDEYNERHKPGDITLDDLKKAAQNHNLDVEKAADNIHNAARGLKQAGKIS